MTTRTNELSTKMALNIMYQNKNTEVQDLEYSIKRLEDMLRNQKGLLEGKKENLARIKDAQANKDCTLDFLLNL